MVSEESGVMGVNQGPGTQLRAASQYQHRLRYAFATLHVHGALYKQRGLLTAGGKGFKPQVEILKLLEVVWEPPEVAVVHRKGHQKGGDPVAKGNRHADAATKEAAHSLQKNLKSC